MEKKYYDANPEKYRQRERERYQRRKEKIGAWWRKKWANDPEWKAKKTAINKRYRQSAHGKEIRNKNAKERRQFWRKELFAILGGAKCVRCGYDQDARALQFDHINGGGRKHREKFKVMSAKYYRFHVENPELAKETFQVLCANCNQIKKFDQKEM